MPKSKRKPSSPTDGGNWGIVGGSFDPIHLGHLIMAESIMSSLKADGMIFVPTLSHPLKTNDTDKSSFPDRLAMVEQAIAPNPRFYLQEPPAGPGYTLDLIDYLRNLFPRTRLFLVVGSDIVEEFSSWYENDEIERSIKIIIATRPGFDPQTNGSILKGAERVMIPQIDISSTNIRRRLARRQSIKYMVPSIVEQFILEKGLYRVG